MINEVLNVNKDFNVIPTSKDNEVHTAATILSFPHVFKSAVFNGVDSGKYSCIFMIPKSDKATIKVLQDAFRYVHSQNIATTLKGTNIKELWKNYLKDGDKKAKENEKDEIYKGFYLLKASSKVEKGKPKLKDIISGMDITDEGDIYGGVIARGHIRLWAYEYAGKKGITTYLYGISKLKDYKKFGSDMDMDEANANLTVPKFTEEGTDIAPAKDSQTPQEADDLIGDMDL